MVGGPGRLLGATAFGRVFVSTRGNPWSYWQQSTAAAAAEQSALDIIRFTDVSTAAWWVPQTTLPFERGMTGG